jgi:hypothetical protein
MELTRARGQSRLGLSYCFMRYTIKPQLSIVLPNQPGEVAKVCQILTENKVNMEGVMFVDTTLQGVVRFLVEEPVRAKRIFEDAGYFVATSEVLEVELTNEVGCLEKFSRTLGEAGVNIDYAYGNIRPDAFTAPIIFKLSDMKRGIEILQKL